MTLQNGNNYNLNDPDLSTFITVTHFDKIPQNKYLIYNFLNGMNYDLNDGDKKSSRYNLIKVLIFQYIQQQQSQPGSGFNQYIFLLLSVMS